MFISGLEIIPKQTKSGKHHCPHCKRDFNTYKLVKKGDMIEKRCPRCNTVLGVHKN